MLKSWRKSLTLISILAFLTCTGFAHEEKGIPKKELKVLFPQATSFVAKPVNLTDQQHELIERTLHVELGAERKSVAYIAVANGRSQGLAWFTHVQWMQGLIDVGVAINSSGVIQKVILSEPDKAVNNSRFLRQFQGKFHGSKFTEIKAPGGKEKEAQAIILAVRKALLVLDTLIPHAESDTGRKHTEIGR